MSPGPLATYVRLCPRISPSSRTPPSAIRWNGRSSALAIDCPSEVLPVPGGPTNLSKSKFEGAYRNQFSHNQKCGEKMDIQQYGSLDAPPDAPSHNRLRGRLGVHVRVIPHERLGRRLGLQLLRRPARLDGEPRLRFCLCLARAFGGLLLSGLHLAQPHDGEVLDEPPLDAVESEVIRVELALRIRQEGSAPDGRLYYRCITGRGWGRSFGVWPREGREPVELKCLNSEKGKYEVREFIYSSAIR